MKVLIATLGLTGDDDRVYHKETVSLLAAGHAVTLATNSGSPPAPAREGFRHLELGGVGLADFSKRLAGLAREWPADALQINGFELLATASRIKKTLGIPLLYDVQDTHREMWATFSSKPPVIRQLINWGLGRFEKRHAREVDVVLAASRLIERRYGKWKLKTVFVPNYPRLRPVDLNGERPPLVIYHGQLSVERGIPQLVQAFGSVLESVPEARLEIYGRARQSGLAEVLQAQVEGMGFAEAVQIKPAIPHQAILEKLTEARIGVIPFLDRPLFRVAPANKLFEYMLCGCAVVASDLPILREDGREAVCYVPPGDVPALTAALTELLQHPGRQRELAARGRKLVETTYNWGAIEEDYRAIFQEEA